MKKTCRETVLVLGDNWSSAVVLNGIIMPFFIPIAVWMILCQCYSSILIKNASSLDSWYIITFSGLLPTVLILFLGLSGYFFANRKIFYEQDGAVRRSFIEGFKKNWAKYLLYGVIFWLSISVACVSTAYYLKSDINDVLSGIGIALSVIQAIFVIPIIFISMVQNVFFEDKLKCVFKNAVKVLIIKPSIIITSLLALLPIFITVMLPFIWQISLWIMLSLVFSTVSATLLTVKIGNVFYKIIEKNKNQENNFSAEDSQKCKINVEDISE